MIRSTSLSGVANRYISITPGPDNEPVPRRATRSSPRSTPPPRSTSTSSSTPSARRERKGLQDIIQGSATVYAGTRRGGQRDLPLPEPRARPRPTSLIQELNRDQQVFSDFLVNGARVVGAVAERRDDLAGLTSNGNQFLGAIAEQNVELDRALERPAAGAPPGQHDLLQPPPDPRRPRPARRDVEADDEEPRAVPPPVQARSPASRSRSSRTSASPSTGRARTTTSPTRLGKLPAVQNAAARHPAAAVQAMIDSEPDLQLHPPLLARPLGAARQARPDHRQLRRQRQATPASQPAGLGVFQQRRRHPQTRSRQPTSSAATACPSPPAAEPQDLPPLPRRRHPARRRRAPTPSSPTAATWLSPARASPADCTSTDVPPGP